MDTALMTPAVRFFAVRSVSPVVRSSGARLKGGVALGALVLSAFVSPAFVSPAAGQTAAGQTAAGRAAAGATAAFERNLPPAPPAAAGGLQSGPSASVATDDTPLGVDLSGIRVIGLSDPVESAPPPGVGVAPAVEGLDEPAFRAVLEPFIGKPLSRKLLADAQAAVAQAYRNVGRPFVSVTAPPQEVTGGVLQLRVAPFKTGDVRVRDDKGVVSAAQTPFGDAVRAPTGKLIEAERISEDLEWLNRFPYRQLNGVFEPGSDPGYSNLTLEAGRKKPWQVFAGWSNASNVRDREQNRYFIGFGAGVETWRDMNFSYQLTGSRDVTANPDSVRLAGTGRPSYLSHAGRLVISVAARQAVSVTPSYVATSRDGADGLLNFRNTTFELPVVYRSALSNFSVGLAGWGDVYVGATPKWMARRTFHQGVELAGGTAGVFDASLGWNVERRDVGGAATAVDLRLVANRGLLIPGNGDANWNLFTNGRVTDADYVYFYGTFDRTTPLPVVAGLSGASWTVGAVAQVAGKALPDTEQLALGGMYAARGYTLNDGAADAGFILRNELRLSSTSALGRFTADAADGVSPYAFIDVAYGYNYNADYAGTHRRADATLIGVGVGADYSLATSFGVDVQAGFNIGAALTDGPETNSGTVTAQGRVFIGF